MRLRRPYIPLVVRVAVAERQCREHGLVVPSYGFGMLKERLRRALLAISHFLPGKLELHHRPALVNRLRNFDGSYTPAANDPNFLVYVPKHNHDIETRVRGLGAQRSDLGQRRYNKKIARNRMAKDKKRIGRWPKRKLRSKPINARWRRKAWPKRKMVGRRREGRRTHQRASLPRRGLS